MAKWLLPRATARDWFFVIWMIAVAAVLIVVEVANAFSRSSGGLSDFQAGSPGANEGIAFQSNRDGNFEIYVMNAKGGDQTRLTKNSVEDRNPVWSPDARKIAFHSDRSGKFEVYVMKANGRGQRRLTHSPSGEQAGFPAWSPNGKR